MKLQKQECKNKRVHALGGGWTQIGNAKKKKSAKMRADALRGGWPMIGIAKRVQK